VVYPIPLAPYNYFPYAVLAWVVVGVAIVLNSPKLVERIGKALTEVEHPSRRVKPSRHGKAVDRGGGRPTRPLVHASAAFSSARNFVVGALDQIVGRVSGQVPGKADGDGGA
jgi:hypothetical protein